VRYAYWRCGHRRRRRKNDFAYDWLAKLDVASYDILRAFDLMFQGKMNGYFCQGFNPLLAFPNRKKLTVALSNLTSW
jgi:formate dehydrogenase major subunit